MTRPGNENLLRRFRILVAPLDWGLGHATRCIPVIKELLANDCEVWLAGEGEQEAILKTEFPALPFLTLEGYRTRYSKNNVSWKIMLQVPQILFAIRREHRWLRKAVFAHGIDAVISDNRFGLYPDKVPAIFITHQLNIKSPFGKRSEKILRNWNYKYINRFTECWVPDTNEENDLAGDLSHPDAKPAIPITYIGLLSRFQQAQGLSAPPNAAENNHLLFLLSGPEPQRTFLEDQIINEVSHYAGTATIVRGRPSSLSTMPSSSMIKIYNHLPAHELYEEIKKAEWVISRSGYSTVMDLLAMQKKAIFIPTPGQTEQEYLARYLSSRHIAPFIEQKNFSLEVILDQARTFNYELPTFDGGKDLTRAVQNLLYKLAT